MREKQKYTPNDKEGDNSVTKVYPRIAFLDEVRGVCVILMVIYHAIYTVGYVFEVRGVRRLFWQLSPLEPFFAGVFIFLCGLCCALSHSNGRRGARLAAVACGVSAVMAVAFPATPIWFGVLHMLAVCLLLYAALARLLRRVPPAVGVAVCALLFCLCWNVPAVQGGRVGLGDWSWRLPAALTRQRWLYALGIGRIGGEQADYFPLLPWMFCFFAGSFVGQPVAAGRIPAWMYRAHVPPLALVGRHALPIYLVHQPVIWGVGHLIAAVAAHGS